MVADPGRRRPKAWGANFWQTCDAGSSWSDSSVAPRKCGLSLCSRLTAIGRGLLGSPAPWRDLAGQNYPARCARIEVHAAYPSGMPDGQLNEQVAQTRLRAAPPSVAPPSSAAHRCSRSGGHTPRATIKSSARYVAASIAKSIIGTRAVPRGTTTSSKLRGQLRDRVSWVRSIIAPSRRIEPRDCCGRLAPSQVRHTG
jgi:hypothetical protein